MFGSLSDFSLGELFQVLEQGEQTGRLTINSPDIDQSTKNQRLNKTPRNYHIWFRRGLIVAAANSLDNQGLSKLIDQRSWIEGGTSVLAPGFCNTNLPLGICFKSHGLITAEQLKLLFSVQVLRQVCQLFTLLHGRYHFDEKAPLAYPEMTGLSALATDVTLAGLRKLNDWSALEDKLPEPESALLSIVEGQPHLKLNQSELRVWEFADGTVSLKDVAARLDLSLDKVRKIAFRLSVVNLAEEFPLLISASDMMNISLDDEPVDEKNNLFFLEDRSPKIEAAIPKHNNQEFTAPPPVSDDFLQELMKSLNNS
ncbi:MAG: DUF4388 domain-containing protein [Limnothrix sp.]